MAFSQRKYHGFRNHVEFDKKRILVSGTNEFSIYGYVNSTSDTSYKLLHHQLGPDDEIKYADFIEDIVPKYLFMIINNTTKKESYLYIKLICKNKEFFSGKTQESETTVIATPFCPSCGTKNDEDQKIK